MVRPLPDLRRELCADHGGYKCVDVLVVSPGCMPKGLAPMHLLPISAQF